MQLADNIIEIVQEKYQDHIYDIADEYGEPGYRSSGPIMFGDWWCRNKKCKHNTQDDNGRTKLHTIQDHHPRLWSKIENDLGVELEWYDEWYVDNQSYPNKAWRTQGDSYSWQCQIRWTDYGDPITPDDDINVWLELCVNNHKQCLPRGLFSDEQLSEKGFEEYNCEYRNGWYGQEDDPEKISEAIRKYDDVDILYVLSNVGQFEIGFCVYVKEKDKNAII